MTIPLTQAVLVKYNLIERNRMHDSEYFWLENINDSARTGRSAELVQTMCSGSQFRDIRVGPAYDKQQDRTLHPISEKGEVGLYVHVTTGLVGGSTEGPSLDCLIVNPERVKRT